MTAPSRSMPDSVESEQSSAGEATPDVAPGQNQPRGRHGYVGKVVFNVFGILLGLGWVFPVYWMFNSSFQLQETLDAITPSAIPWPFTTEHYSTVFEDPSFWSSMRMSAIVTTGTVVVVMLCAFLGAVVLSRFKFRSRRGLIVAVLIVQMIPPEALFISQYRVLDDWGLINTAVGLTLLNAGATIPITIWMLKGFVDSIPVELEEAGMTDGCSRLGAFVRITAPLLAPGMVVSGIFAMLAAWNEYTLALVIMQDNAASTLPLWLAKFQTPDEAVDWGGVMAGSAVIALPVIIVFLLVQRQMATGLSAGAVKG